MLRRISKFNFVQNVVKLMLGAGLGQLVSFLAAPFIAKIYGPESFGEQSTILSVVSTVAALASMAFPIAIVIAKSDEEAIDLSMLAFLSSLGLASIATSLFLFNDMWLLLQMGLGKIGEYVTLIPVLVALTTMSMSAQYMLTRQAAFGNSAFAAVVASVVGNVSKLAFGVVSPCTMSLIAGNALGYLVWPAIALRFRRRTSVKGRLFSVGELKKTALRHLDFPLYRAPQNFISALSQAVPVVGLTAGFGSTSAGYYAMAMAIAGAPVMLIGNAVQPVLYQRLTSAFNSGEDVSKILLYSTLGLTVLGASFFIVSVCFGTQVFESLLGVEWKTAGLFSAYLMVSLWFWLVARPVMAIIPVFSLQRDLLIFELFGSGVKIVSVVAAVQFSANPAWLVGLYSGITASMWLLVTVWVLNKARIRKQSSSQ